MKKILLLIVLAIGGYQLYQQKFSAPYLGEWLPSPDLYITKHFPNGVNDQQREIINKTISQFKMSITKDKFSINDPSERGVFVYTVEKQPNGCFLFTYTQSENAMACIKDKNMTFTFNSNGEEQYTMDLVKSD